MLLSFTILSTCNSFLGLFIKWPSIKQLVNMKIIDPHSCMIDHPIYFWANLNYNLQPISYLSSLQWVAFKFVKQPKMKIFYLLRLAHV